MTKEEQDYFLEINGVKAHFEIEPGIFKVNDNKYAVLFTGPTFLEDVSLNSLVFCDSLEQAKELMKEEDND